MSTDPAPVALAAAILEVRRALRPSLPAPKGAPFYGLDVEFHGDPSALEALSGPGIFRKYEQVLLIGGGFGGCARWLSSRLGCRIVALAEDADVATAAARLQAASQHDGHVDFLASSATAVPLVAGGVTHAWVLGVPAELEPTLAEAMRSLRPGGQFALQWLEEAAPGQMRDLEAQLRHQGFESIEWHRVVPREQPQAFRLARQRLAGELERRGLARPDRTGPLPAELLQLHARRPA